MSDTERFRRQLRWQPWKALAAVVALCAVFLACALAVATWVHPTPQMITVHVKLPPPK